MKEGLKNRTHLRALKRLDDIHKEIVSGSFPDIRSLAKLLEVNSRTVKRDLAILRDSLNAPIIYDRRSRGFRYAETGWALPLQRITEGELLAFFIAENALRVTGHTNEAIVLKSSLAKITAMLPDEVTINIATLGEMASFQNLPSASADPKTLEVLARAAVSCQSVEIDYYSPHSGEHTTRIIDPHCLHNFAGDWFVVAHDHLRGKMRDFHIGRIKNLHPLDKTFEKQKKWNAAEYLRKGFYMTRGGRLTNVEIVFDAYQSQWIRERHFFHPDETRKEMPDGRLRLSFKIGENGLEAVARFCLTYAGHCVAEKPRKLREIIRDKLKISINHYENK